MFVNNNIYKTDCILCINMLLLYTIKYYKGEGYGII